jgi:hypothetical protein
MFKGVSIVQKKWSIGKIMDKNIEFAKEREYYFELLMKLVSICDHSGLRLIIENPWNTSGETYLQRNFIKPTIIDKDRSARGDVFVKPTAYWFIGCENTVGYSLQRDKEVKVVYKTYDASNFPKLDSTAFVNVKAIFVNNTKSDVENLAILFAYVDEFVSNATKDYRIVVAAGCCETQDGTQNIYDILDIKTGTVTADVTTSCEGYESCINDIVVLDTEGRIKGSVSIESAYMEDRLFATTFADYDKENKMLTVCEDANTYQLSDDTTILLYFDDAYYYMTDDSVLTIDEDTITNEDLKGCMGLQLYMIAEDDEDNDSIKNVKNIVVVPMWYDEW